MKETWIEQINDISGDYLTKQQLAFILDVSISQISYCIDAGFLKYVKMSPAPKAAVRIPKEAAIQYIQDLPEA